MLWCCALSDSAEFQSNHCKLKTRLWAPVWCRNGTFIHELANLPLAEDIPIAFNSCRKGPRSLGWRSDKPAEMVWTEAQVSSSLCDT